MSRDNNSLFTDQVALNDSTATQVLGSNPNRIFAEITNDDDAIKIYFGVDSDVDASSGHALSAGRPFGFERYTGPVWAIAASGTPTVTVVEW